MSRGGFDRYSAMSSEYHGAWHHVPNICYLLLRIGGINFQITIGGKNLVHLEHGAKYRGTYLGIPRALKVAMSKMR